MVRSSVVFGKSRDTNPSLLGLRADGGEHTRRGRVHSLLLLEGPSLRASAPTVGSTPGEVGYSPYFSWRAPATQPRGTDPLLGVGSLSGGRSWAETIPWGLVSFFFSSSPAGQCSPLTRRAVLRFAEDIVPFGVLLAVGRIPESSSFLYTFGRSQHCTWVVPAPRS